RLTGVFALNARAEEAYLDVSWLFGIQPVYLHRLLVAPESLRQGVALKALEWMAREAVTRGHDTLRLDAFTLNHPALRLYKRFGMRPAGDIYMNGRSDPYRCFEKPLRGDSPMLPVPMTPAWRYGIDTPWGGDRLQTCFNKKAPGALAGESLEVSAMPGLNSLGPMGEPLQEMISRYGRPLLGTDAQETFPLLLKLIDAREPLSVQVHPDDDYACQHEHGKSGKEEAWVVLQADKNAGLICGLKEGVALQTLRETLDTGADAEALLRRIPVRPMDVLFIPAGCVHAIGAGIVLYEIQQSSDLTYRLYDYNRRGADGKKRALHIDKALEVCNPSVSPAVIRVPRLPGVTRLLDTQSFSLDSVHVRGRLALPRFSSWALLTALEDVVLHVEDTRIPAEKGRTFLIPASCPPLVLSGRGRALIAIPPAPGRIPAIEGGEK
ncbi:MAG: GNAT family N-acetyltransferase, partial [Clostridia bacterium]|nr:GNAT family N-acetyltransferase [Clostridia bacterium]